MVVGGAESYEKSKELLPVDERLPREEPKEINE